MTQARVERNIVIQCMRDRMPLPDKIQNAPELAVGLDLYWEAFWDLNSCRALGWGMGPIPWTAVNSYAKAYKIKGEQREDLFYYVRELDTAYMEHKASKSGGNKATKGWGAGR